MSMSRREVLEAFVVGGAAIASKPMVTAIEALGREQLTLAQELERCVNRYRYIDRISAEYRPDKMAYIVYACYRHTPKHPEAMFAMEYDDIDSATIQSFAKVANRQIKRLVT